LKDLCQRFEPQINKIQSFPKFRRMPKPSSSSQPVEPVAPDAGGLPATYEAALQELEQLVTELEAGQLPLDRLLGSYQRGAALLAFCRDRLQAVEDQIKVLDAGSLKAWAGE
jgi:exodeoxyribonuclease VII small subunit